MTEDDRPERVRTIEPLLLSIPDAAKALGIGRSTLYRLIEQGDLTPVRIGRSVRFRVAALNEYVQRLQDDT